MRLAQDVVVRDGDGKSRKLQIVGMTPFQRRPQNERKNGIQNESSGQIQFFTFDFQLGRSALKKLSKGIP